ncbi:MAG: class I SAM-dependent RNA methyltransferase [Bacteroidota bacterium]|nr:class I SAM-dependent RNA methyltransferase [Bacteroidota bacterium]
MDFNLKSYIRVTCGAGVMPYLSKEITDLGLPILDESLIHIGTHGTMMDCIKLCTLSRTAHKVLFEIKKINAKHPDELYKHIKTIEWEDIIPENGYFSVDSTVENQYIKDTRFANVRVKDAIVDRFQSQKGFRPDSGPDNSRTVIYVHWRNNEAIVYIDASGETLAKHGYRKMPWKAPLQESLAAGIVLASGWDTKSNFINPMCGSGTLAIEAALIMTQKFPGNFRSNYGFNHIVGFEEAYKPVNELNIEAPTGIKYPEIIASDISKDAIRTARKNAIDAGVDDLIEFYHCGFEETPIPESGGTIIMNPEYGERMGEQAELEELYPEIGDFFKQKCAGYTGYIFTGNLDLAKTIGLKPSSKQTFFNAKIECRLLGFEIYKGKKESKTNE